MAAVVHGRPLRRVAWRLLPAILAFALALAVANGAALAATSHALLVGVSGYAGLEPRYALRGPANDVRLILDLMDSGGAPGFLRDNVVVLADGLDGADGLPTLAAIRAALAALPGRVTPGDFVYLHFSGHGSRQRAARPDLEADGLDEVFLPADARHAVDGIYPNALVDDELGAAIDAIRAAGAFVWIVVDSCHSATATRSAAAGSGGLVERMLPDAAEPRGSARPAGSELPIPFVSERTGWGGLAAFFAAQTVEPTPEMLLPRRDSNAAHYGLFTYMLYQVMARKPGLTYRELAQGVMHAYAAKGFNRPTPLFEGDLDRPVFGGEPNEAVLQWPIELSGATARLPAGQLHGIEREAVLALLADPLAPAEEARGYVRVTDAGPLTSTVEPVAHGGAAAPDLSALPPGAVARPVDVPIAFELALFLPETAAALDDARNRALVAVHGVIDDATVPVNLRLLKSNQGADLILLVASEKALYPDDATDDAPRLWFVPADGRLDVDPRLKPHSIGLGAELPEEALAQLKENLAAAFRALGLARLSALSQLHAPDLVVELSLVRQAADGAKVAIDAAAAPAARPGDVVAIKVANGGGLTVDVDVLVVSPDYSIRHVMYDRFHPGDGVESGLLRLSASNFGGRRFIVIARETRRHMERTDLRFLEQVGMQTRGAAATGARSFHDMLSDIARSPRTRGAVALTGARAREEPRGFVKMLKLVLLPSDR